MRHKTAELEGPLLDAAVAPERAWTDLVGHQVGELLVLSLAGANTEGRRTWACACACGGLVEMTTKQIRVNRLDYCQSVYHRLIRQSAVDPVTNCWLWQGKVNRSGYGVTKERGINRVAHRVMYAALFGEFDRALRACHRCDTPTCINPFHIFLGTQRDNMLDMHRKGRFNGGAKPGNRNAVGNKGWLRGGIVKQLGRVPASKIGEEVEIA